MTTTSTTTTCFWDDFQIGQYDHLKDVLGRRRYEIVKGTRTSDDPGMLQITAEGTVNIHGGGAGSDLDAFFKCKYHIIGDFDIQIDFDNARHAEPSSGVNYGPVLRIQNADNSKYIWIGRTRSWGSNGFGYVATSDSLDVHTQANASGKLRLTRSGSTIKAYYWDTSQSRWEWENNTGGKTFTTSWSGATVLWVGGQAETSSNVAFDMWDLRFRNVEPLGTQFTTSTTTTTTTTTYTITTTTTSTTSTSTTCTEDPNDYPVSLNITNRGFETGDITGWTQIVGSGASVFSGSPSGPGGSGGTFEGSYALRVGASSMSEVYQEIDLVSAGICTTDIDKNKLSVRVASWRRTYSGDRDQGTHGVAFLNSADSEIGRFYGISKNVDVWTKFTDRFDIPTGTRKIRILLRGWRQSGTNLDAYFDYITAVVLLKPDRGIRRLYLNNAKFEKAAVTDWTTDFGSSGLKTSWGVGSGAFYAPYFWYGGVVTASQVYQELDLRDFTKDFSSIDSGNELLRLRWDHSTYSQSDIVRATVQFLSKNNKELGVAGTQHHYDVIHTTWVEINNKLKVPPYTRKIRIFFRGTRTAGTNQDGYFDNVDVRLQGDSLTTSTSTTTTTTTTTTTSSTTSVTTTHWWEEDFEGMTVDQAPTNWTETWDTANVDTLIKSPRKWKHLNLDKTSNAKIAVIKDVVSKYNIEILGLVQAKDAFSTFAGGLGGRISGGIGTETGYVVFMDPANNKLKLRRYNNGTSSDLADGSYTINADSWYWIRMRLNGSNIKARIWPKLGTEPGTWLVDYTDASPLTSAGEAGVCCLNADVNCDYIAFEGSSAGWPIPVPSGYNTTTTTTTEGPCEWNDYFTEKNGPAPPAQRWTESGHTQYGSILNKKYHLAFPDSSGQKNTYLFSTYQLSGDFDIQIDFEVTTLNEPSTGINFICILGIKTSSPAGAYNAYIGRMHDYEVGTGHNGYCFNSDDDVYTKIYQYPHTSGKLRYTRVGSVHKVFYWHPTNERWEWDGNTAGQTLGYTSTADMYVQLQGREETYGNGVVGDWDNFIINKGCPGAPYPTTTTTTTYTTTTTTSTTTTIEPPVDYSTNWGEYTSDQAPNDWTELWELPVAAITVKDDGGQYGGKYLLIDHSTYGHYFAEWDDIVQARDTDILAKVQFGDPNPVTGDDYFKIVCRQTGGNSNKNGYEVRLYPDNDEVKMFKWVNNSASQIGSTKTFTFTTYWYWVRFQVRGNTIRVKVWVGQPSDEPGTWDISTTDSAHAGVYGTVGLGSYNGDATRCDYYAVGVGATNDAPVPADYLTTTTTTTTTTATTTTGTTETPMEPPWYTAVGTLQTS